MKVILYMAIAANGYIAREDGETPWSEEEFKAYYDFVRERENVIVGRKTYELMQKSGEFRKAGNPLAVVVSKTSHASGENVVFASSPQEGLEVLRGRGFKEAVLGGGSALNTAFLEENLIDEAILDVEPFFFGGGIPLFKSGEADLELLNISKISQNTLRLHYRVRKSNE